MEIELTAEESDAVESALRRYLSELRMEIVDTDNPEFKRTLRAERESLERALAKLDASHHAEPSTESPGVTGSVRVVRMWWSATEIG
jgi:hypothetical protein